MWIVDNLSLSLSLSLSCTHPDFSNRLDRPAIKTLAESDEHESVREIKEFYGDYIAVGSHIFSFNIDQCAQPGSMWRRDEFLRVVDGLVAVMLALRKRPVIR